ncbi:RDD domain containing protein [uncultured Mycobacterium sp.]|uniref:RDD domain containing protein n=1 Tax=uncultured Mycobacterium sp. TaxID=171292 RepID=A0A1Y5PHT3_9MYCO|nr:RDD domain containing protein [uncultured Mycobacterium sp.]
MTGTADLPCSHCGSILRPNAPFCAACGQAVPNRPTHLLSNTNTATQQHVPAQSTGSFASDQVVEAGRGVRCCSHLLDVAAMLSPAFPIAIAATILGLVDVIYIVVPIAFVAVSVWMSLWRSLTGMTFGTATLGLRTVRTADNKPPGFAAVALRSLVFTGTAGLAALPVLTGPAPRQGLHDRVVGISVIDISLGANPFGQRQQTPLRRTLDRGLRKVSSPVPVGAGPP